MEVKVIELKKTARQAGVLYFIWVLSGIFGFMYIPSRTIVWSDNAANASKILNNEFLFRLGLINDLVSSIVCVFLLLTLYKLFKHVDERKAKLMFVLFFITLPIGFIMSAFSITSLMILKGELLTTFELTQKQDMAMLFLKVSGYCLKTMEMYWGLWLIPFGQLIWKSGFIPRILGVFLILNGIAYIIPSLASLLFPDYDTVITQIAMPFWILGEISITLWLLIKGVKNNPVHIPVKTAT